MRTPNTNRFGGYFDNATVQALWEKAQIVPGLDPNFRRKDACGAWIDRHTYGTTVPNGNGWEIDHIMPVARGGADLLINLQPLQWQNNRHKGDSHPTNWGCLVKAA